MKKHFASFAAAACLLFAAMGCGIADRIQQEVTGSDNTNANKPLTDRAVDTAVGEQKIGVPECDEVMDMLATYANNPDDNFVVKAGKAMIVNKIRDAIKTSVAENKTDTVELAKDCRQIKTELEKSMAAEANEPAK